MGVNYRGIDVCPEMIARARKLHPEREFAVREKTLLTEEDRNREEERVI